MTTTIVNAAACANCGAELHGQYCARCGQEVRPLDPTLAEVAGEAARELSDLDGRFFGSVRHLFLSPGFLTNEHFAGRRARWVSPVRLYLFFSVCYFAITSYTGTSPIDFDFSFGAGGAADAETTRELQRLGYASEAELRSAVTDAMNAWIPRAMFVLVPMVGWFVSLVRRGSGRHFPHHVIFACHVFALFFAVQSIAVAAGYLSGSRVVATTFGVAGLVYAVTGMVRAMRAVYGGTLLRAILHTTIVLFLYWIATTLVAGVIVLSLLFGS